VPPPTRASIRASFRPSPRFLETLRHVTLRREVEGGSSQRERIFHLPTNMMSLKEVVERYAAKAEQFGDPVSLQEFGLTPEQITNLFTSFDEDYHISRFMNFSMLQGHGYLVSGNPATHVRIDEGIRSIL
jgi:hypothetical protein